MTESEYVIDNLFNRYEDDTLCEHGLSIDEDCIQCDAEYESMLADQQASYERDVFGSIMDQQRYDRGG
jgi:hypothetical protein